MGETTSLRDRLYALEIGQKHTYDIVKEIRDLVKAQNGRIRTVEDWQSNRSFLEKISVPALEAVGILVGLGVAFLTIVKAVQAL